MSECEQREPQRPSLFSSPATRDEIRALINRTHKKNPKRKDIQALRNMLRDTELWRLAGEAAEHAVAKIIDHVSGEKVFLAESLREGSVQPRWT